MNTIYDTEERRLLREQLRRFVTAEVVPVAERWEEAGMVPRAVLRAMGNLGFLGIRYPESFGGSGQDTMGSIILAEELGRSGFGGFAATVQDLSTYPTERLRTEQDLLLITSTYGDGEPPDNARVVPFSYHLVAARHGFAIEGAGSRRLSGRCPTLFWGQQAGQPMPAVSEVLAYERARGFPISRLWFYRIEEGWIAADRPLNSI